MHTTYFETYNLLTCPTTVSHVEQIRKGSYIGSRRWRIAAIGIVTAALMPAYNRIRLSLYQLACTVCAAKIS